MTERIGLVLEGGGVRGAYTAGALAWLNDNGIKFDYHVGISSGAVYLCCYAVGDKHTPYNMSVFYANDSNTVGLKALMQEKHYVAYRKIFTDDLLGREHMDVSGLKDVDIEVGAYVLEHGQTEFFGPEDIDPDLTLLRGTCALPVAAEIVEYKGMHLLDGGITKMIPIERALEKGCTKCMVITTKPADFVRKPSSPAVRVMMKMLYPKYPQVEKDYVVRHINYYKQVDIIKNLVSEGSAIQISPSETIEVSRFKGTVDKCQQLYNLGYKDMEQRREEILAFMSKGEEE
jgi:predicted patatin/cPLA2 family phospholipase